MTARMYQREAFIEERYFRIGAFKKQMRVVGIVRPNMKGTSSPSPVF